MFQYKSKINQSKGNENDLIKTISLRKTYGISKTPVLDSIDFVLKRGECTCIVGPNGSGKTTFLNIILGIIPKSSGKIILKGKIGFSPETSINFQWPVPTTFLMNLKVNSSLISNELRGFKQVPLVFL